MQRKLLTVFGVFPLISGCATASFSPPSVNLENEMASVGSNRAIGQRCMPNQRLADDGKPIRIQRNAKGAQRLIDNFVYMYRCRAHSAANGRQAFEVPALLTGIGTTAAIAFGAGADVAIAGGTATALFNGGKAYYEPQKKADIYDSALDALLCIKLRAVNIDPITVEKMSKLQAAKSALGAAPDDDVPLTAEERYFELISASLLSVERVLAQRLSVVGTFDPAGVIAEIKSLTAEESEKEEEAQKSAPATAQALTDTSNDARAGAGQVKVADIVPASDKAAETKQIENTIVGLETLQPKMQQCVVRAKI